MTYFSHLGQRNFTANEVLDEVNFKVCFDNYFTSIGLLLELISMGILPLGIHSFIHCGQGGGDKILKTSGMLRLGVSARIRGGGATLSK